MTRIFSMLCAVALFAAVPKMPAPTPAPSQSSSVQIGQWNLKTDQLGVNTPSGAFSAPDHVTLTRADGSVVVADRATGNYKQRQATLYGHVSIHDASGTFGLRSAQGAQSRGPATLTADHVQLDDTTHIFDAAGNVHYEQGDTMVDAQTAHLNDVTHQLDLSGKVHIVQGNRTLDAGSATYNTQSGLGEADSNVLATFPGITPSIATPKPITIKAPKIP
jgi:lipopolysaccharide assembly outer membrane protein LptD (OstA)